VNILPFLAFCTAGAFLGLLCGPIRILARLAGLAGLAAAFAAAAALGQNAQLTVGEVQLETTRFVGLFLTAGTGICLLVCLLGLTSGWPERLAPAALATFGALAVALSATDPGVALIAGAAAAAPGALVAINSTGGFEASAAMSGARVAGVRVAELRTLALIVGGAMLAAASALLPSWNGDPSPFYALAVMVLGLAIAVRCGVVPFHVLTARLSTTASGLALPLPLVWIPAGLAVIAAAWAVGTYGVESGWYVAALRAISVLGVVTLVLGAIGALLHDELEEIAAYSIVQDAGFIMLALSARDAGVGEPLRLWLLAFIVVKPALLAWVSATAWMYGSSHLQDLRGWARRAPVLALVLLLIVVATLGWPSSAIYEARSTLIRLSLPGQLQFLTLAVAALALACYGRLLAIGLLPPGERVLSAAGDRPRRHAPEPELAGAAPELALASTELGSRAARAAALRAAAPRRRPTGGLLTLWRVNSPIRVSLLALAIAVLSVVIAFGGLGASEAARTGSGLDLMPGASDEIPTESESPGPSVTESASPSATDSPPPTPTATPKPKASQTGTALASPSPTGTALASPSPSQTP
jgi:NADH:ubiquinone oxidoreductase subunit 2 (subunit N)